MNNKSDLAHFFKNRLDGENKKCKDKFCEPMVNGNCKRYCEGHALKYEAPEKRTKTKKESLANSQLIHIKYTNPKEKDLVEAFCRDVHSFNLAFQVCHIIKGLL